MKHPKTSVAALALSLLVALSTPVVSQAATCSPGQIMTPCSSATQAPVPGETATPAAVALGEIDTSPVASGERSLTEIASSVLLSIVSLF
jgi:hypothetical protein